jgi:hypothetical protein
MGSGNRTQRKEFDFDMDTVPISKRDMMVAEHELNDRDLTRSDSLQGDNSSTSSSRHINKHEIRRDVTFTVEHLQANEQAEPNRLRSF